MTAAQIRKAMAKNAHRVDQDLRVMARVRKDVGWLLDRDSNCGLAASLCDAIDVLIRQAEKLHTEELKECQVRAKRGKF